ncbi:hypothetical protein AVANS14531_04930 [Campylobacter sp. Cr9]|uniref:hypothetical protein n=1 Tax=unclassified Campylobacter TaxID=2593542 RepID=UPI003014C6CA|nr:hypothetical protein [Campylobacter sp. RM12637]MBZ7985677.1 hypothetical protein [Campylobacter sp. Cr9]
MTNRELANFLNITYPTLYNWEKTKPNLYKIVMAYKNNKNSIESNLINELIENLKKLSEKEQEKILLEIKLKIINKELGE